MKIQPEHILIESYNYPLPPERIAEFPLPQRDQSKLLVYKSGKITDERFFNLPHQLPEGAALVVNDTRVIEARLLFQKETGGIIEIFCLEPHQSSIEQALGQNRSVQWKCLIGGASKWKPGQLLKKSLSVNENDAELQAKYIGREEDSFIIEFSWQPEDLSFSDIIHAAGNVPLPPYIKRKATEQDKKTYQTIFSKYEGSVAAPTAALHFTPEVFSALQEKNISVHPITLHVGAGTFKPVKSQTIAGHQMHQEPFTFSKKTLEQLLQSKNIIAVGTTSLRTIESLHWLGVKLIKGLTGEEWSLGQWEAYDLFEKFPHITTQQSFIALLDWMIKNNRTELHCRTSLMIIPGYPFQIANGLITNFHQPQSTLLLLVSAFIGKDWERVYQHALDHDYRFLSYGDSSLLWRTSAV